MGKAIAEVCARRNHEVVLEVNSDSDPSWRDELKKADVAIEFTLPEAAEENLMACFQAGVPVVTGTTGWYNRFHEVKSACEDLNGSLFYASNFSVGVNLFFQMNRMLARLMTAHPEYSASMKEMHHIRKKDAPSGTAITLAEGIIAEHPGYEHWTSPEHPGNDKLSITSVREADIPGTHEITWTSDVDSIQITHQAFNRKGFAEGAVFAAEFLSGKKGIFTMSDLLNFTETHGL